MDFQINLVSFIMLVIVKSISYLLFVDCCYSICFSVYFYSFFLGYIQTIVMIMDSTLAIAFSFRVIIVGKDFAYWNYCIGFDY